MKNIDNMNIHEILDFLKETSMECGETSISKRLEDASKKSKWYAPKNTGSNNKTPVDLEKQDNPDKKYMMDMGGTISLVPIENGVLNFAKAEIQTLPIDIIVDGKIYRIESNNNISFIPENDFVGNAYEVTGDSLLEVVETIRKSNILH